MMTKKTLPDQTVIFGHGLWFTLILWKIIGYDAKTSQTMRTFRCFP